MQIDDAVGASEERIGRANADARRIVALIAENGKEEPPRRWKRTLFNRFDPAAVDADRDLVLRLARDRAGVTADAFSEIDREPVVGHPGRANIPRVPRRKATETQRGVGHRATEARRWNGARRDQTQKQELAAPHF